MRKTSNKENVKKFVYESNIELSDLIDAKVHFGYRSNVMSPEMRANVIGSKNGMSIIDLRKTKSALENALSVFYKCGRLNKKILFVGTGEKVRDIIKNYATRCGQFYVNDRWLGGMLTNWYTVSKSIKTISYYNKLLESEESDLTKKEVLLLNKKKDKLMSSFGGILEMGSRPDIIFIANTIIDNLAVKEATTLGIPVVAIIDTNCLIGDINYPIPGNDDGIKSIEFYCSHISKAILHGMSDAMRESGVDVDRMLKKPKENVDNNNTESSTDSVVNI